MMILAYPSGVTITQMQIVPDLGQIFILFGRDVSKANICINMYIKWRNVAKVGPKSRFGKVDIYRDRCIRFRTYSLTLKSLLLVSMFLANLIKHGHRFLSGQRPQLLSSL